MTNAWAILTDSCPPGLATNKPASKCDAGETPAATNLSPTQEGFLSAGTQQAGSARTVKTYTIGSDTWEWHFNRLWRLHASLPIIYYGAPRYTDIYLAQDSGTMTFNEDASNPFLALLPVGEVGLLALKAAGAYIIERANTNREEFIHTDFIQEAHVAAATHAVELDGLAYFINTAGMFSIDVQGQITELTAGLRNALPTPAALTCDYNLKTINVGTAYAYDVLAKKWFKYADSFLFTSRELVSQGGEPFAVSQVLFEIERTGDQTDDIAFSYRMDDRDWTTALATTTPDLDAQRAVFGSVDSENGRAFQLKITSLPAYVKVKRIMVNVTGPFVHESRDS
jgi:hypothetical protein